MRVPDTRPLPPDARGIHPIEALLSLKLDPTAVAAHGIVRAAFDAVRDNARVAEMKGAAKTRGQDAYASALWASANLAGRSAEAHAKRQAGSSRRASGGPPTEN